MGSGAMCGPWLPYWAAQMENAPIAVHGSSGRRRLLSLQQRPLALNSVSAMGEPLLLVTKGISHHTPYATQSFTHLTSNLYGCTRSLLGAGMNS